MPWPEDSKHYFPVPSWWDKHPDRSEADFYDGFGEWRQPPSGETIKTDDSWMDECAKLQVW